jgi:cytochrome c peroxidase
MKSSRRRGIAAACVAAVVCMLWAGTVLAAHPEDPHQWSQEELQTLKGLWIGSLPELPPSPSNAYADNPQAAALGKELFFDARFSGNEQVSCGTCHQPDLEFTDALPVAHGMGFTARRTMPILGLGYQKWFFWDGRKDSLWAQALGPLESPVEHGFTRTMCFQLIKENYQEEYEAVFGPLPEVERLRPKGRPAMDNVEALKDWVRMTPQMRDLVTRVYANMGKAIGAYVRTIMPGPSRFDTYVEAALKGDRAAMEAAMKDEEARGLHVFIGSGGCINCHNGPMLTNGDFHNVGVPDKDGRHDRGRADGIAGVLADEFNCLGKYSDAVPSDCAPLKFIDTDSDKYIGAFKTPSLRNVADRPPYMHAGQFTTLHEVLTHYQRVAKEREGEQQGTSIVHGELTDADVRHLEAFLQTLSGPIVEVKVGD